MSKLSSRVLKLAAASAALVAPLTAFAATSPLEKIKAEANKTATGAGVTGGGTDLGTLIGRLINAALGLVGILLVVMIIYAGFLWMTAQGSEDNIKKAKAIIKNAVIGLILIFAAYAITSFVLDQILTPTFTGA